MKTFNLQKLQDKVGAGIDAKISYLIGALILIVLVVALAPDMFDGLTKLTPVYNESNTSQCIQYCDAIGTPAWVPTTLFVIVGAGLIFLVWKAIGGGK